MADFRRRALQVGLAGVFVAAGMTHFAKPRMYEAIVPAALPAHRELVLISGAFEILGGIGALVPATRRLSGWGLIALLFAVFPANIHMALAAGRFAALAPAWGLWARLPLQFVLIWA
ncbi:MAG: DoxX family protein, partial [Candidatus Dormibacteria bacterium]